MIEVKCEDGEGKVKIGLLLSSFVGDMLQLSLKKGVAENDVESFIQDLLPLHARGVRADFGGPYLLYCDINKVS